MVAYSSQFRTPSAFFVKTRTHHTHRCFLSCRTHTRQTHPHRFFLPSSSHAASSSLGPVSDPAFSCFALRTKARLMMTKAAEMCCKIAQTWRSRHRRLCSDEACERRLGPSEAFAMTVMMTDAPAVAAVPSIPIHPLSLGQLFFSAFLSLFSGRGVLSWLFLHLPPP